MTAQHLVALLDGRLVPSTEPLIRPDDLGLTRGDGIFETTLVVDRQPRDLDEHFDRLAASAAALQLTIPSAAEWRVAVNAVVGAWNGGDMTLRLLATRGPDASASTCWVSGDPVSPAAVAQRSRGVSALLLDRGFSGPDVVKSPWLLAGAKTLSYAINMAALRYATAHGADDVIFVGADGYILEAPTATVVAAHQGTLATPPLEGVLDGITVRRLFAAAGEAEWKTEYRRLRPDDLRNADGVWLASSVRLLAPVTALDGAPLPSAEATAELARLLQTPGF